MQNSSGYLPLSRTSSKPTREIGKKILCEQEQRASRNPRTRTWLAWEREVEERYRNRGKRPKKLPHGVPPSPPEGTPERREWEERYAHVLSPSQTSQAPEEQERADEEPLAMAMPWLLQDRTPWRREDNRKLTQAIREQEMAIFQATSARIEARGGYTLNDPIRQRLAARYEAGVEAKVLYGELGGWKPEVWHRAQQQTVAWRIEQVQQRTREICATRPGVVCQIA